MNGIQKFLATPIGGMVRIFVGLVIGGLVLALKTNGPITAHSVWTWVSGALVVVLPLLIAYVNPADTRFGTGSSH